MLKVAVIGIGEQGWDNILPSLAQIPTILTVATCDINQNKADLADKKYGAKPYYDYKKLFEEEELDAVIVASFPQIHYEVAKLAIKRNISVFVEKPPTFTTKDLKFLISLNKNNVTTGVGLNFNYAEAVRMVDELAKRKGFGTINYVSITHYGNKPKEPIWGLDSVVKSFLLAQAIHPIGLMTKYGSILKTYDLKTISDNGNIFISGNFLLQNPNGKQVIGNLTTGNISPHFMWNMEFVTDNSVVIRINSLWELELYDGNKTTALIDSSKRWKDVWNPSPLSNGYSRTGYYHQFEEFFKSVEAHTRYSSSFEHLLPVYEILDILEKELNIEHESIREQVYQY